MWVSSLLCEQFRNIEKVELELGSRVNLFVGPNGQGKTNLLEAMYLLSSGKSFRTSRLGDMVAWGSKEASVFLRVNDSISFHDLGIKFGGRTKTVFRDNKEVRRAVDFYGNLVVVSFSPDDLILVKGGPEERRRLLDKHLVDFSPKILTHLVAYHRALRHKVQLLREEAPARLIEPWNEIMISEGAHIEEGRRSLISRVLLFFPQKHSDFFSSAEDVSVEYVTHRSEDESLRERISKVLPQERKRKVCLCGPHRDDFNLLLGGKPARMFASQGQSRSIVLALKLSIFSVLEQERGEAPVVLLDDVDSELDDVRRDTLMGALSNSNRQVIVTTTDRSLFQKVECEDLRTYSVLKGVFLQE